MQLQHLQFQELRLNIRIKKSVYISQWSSTQEIVLRWIGSYRWPLGDCVAAGSLASGDRGDNLIIEILANGNALSLK